MLRRHLLRRALVVAALLLSREAGAAEGSAGGRSTSSVAVGATSGVGYASTARGGPSGWGYHAGGRVQMAAGGGRSAGVEASYLLPFGDGGTGRYLTIGVVLEQVVWSTFVAAIGTVGYVGLGDTPRSPFGLVSELGVTHAFGPVRPSLTYRAELIFASPTITRNAVAAGLTLAF